MTIEELQKEIINQYFSCYEYARRKDIPEDVKMFHSGKADALLWVSAQLTLAKVDA
jgi:hypothetical protein